MAYELATISNQQPQQQQAQPAREERVVSMYSSDESRYAAAIAKLKGGTAPEIAAVNTNESVAADQTASGASLPLSPQLAALARKEQKFRQEQQALKAKELALDADRKEIAELKALKAKIAAGDYSDIDKMVDYEKLVQHKLGKDPKAEELEKIRAEIAALKADQEKDVSNRFESAVRQRREAVKSLISSEASEFPAIRELKAEEHVVQHILDTWENDEIELSPEQAAKEVEAALLERANKWSALVKPKEQQEPVAEKRELPPLKTGMRTLTNNMAATGEVKRPQKPLHLMNDQERFAEARRRFLEKQQSRG